MTAYSVVLNISAHFPFLNRPDVMEADMSKYLFQVSYTAQGAKGLLEGGVFYARAAAVQAQPTGNPPGPR